MVCETSFPLSWGTYMCTVAIVTSLTHKCYNKLHLSADDIFHGAMKSFQEYITSKENLLKNDKLCTTLEQILNGSGS